MSSCPFPEYRADVRDVQVRMRGLIGDIPWCIGYSFEKFGLISLDDSYVGLSSTSPQIISYTCQDNLSVPSSAFKNPKMKLVAPIRSLYSEKSQQCGVSQQGYCTWLDGGECGSQCSQRPIGSPETSVRNNRYLLRNNSEERSSQLLRSGSLISRIKRYMFRHIRIIIRRKHVRAVGLIRVFNTVVPMKNIFFTIFLYCLFNIIMQLIIKIISIDLK